MSGPSVLLAPFQVRAYHQSYYRPDNLCLIVTGQVQADQLFKALAPFEEKILSKASLAYPLWDSPS